MSLTSLAPPLLFALSVFLSGCSVLAPKEDPTRHFYLKDARPTKLTSRSGLRVLVGPITIPGYLDHSEIITTDSRNEVVLADYHVWAESLEDGVARVLATNISHLLDTPVVVPYPDTDPIDYDYKVPVILRRFEMAGDGKVHLHASYAVAHAALASAAQGQSATLAVTADVDPAAPDSYQAIADAMSRALADLSKALAKDILACKASAENAGAVSLSH